MCIVLFFSQSEEPVSFSEDQSLFEEDVFEAEKVTPILKVCKTGSFFLKIIYVYMFQ